MKNTDQKEAAKAGDPKGERTKKAKDSKQDKRAEIELAAATARFQLHEASDFCFWQKKIDQLHVLPSAGDILLDAGCGSGMFGVSLVRNRATVVGIDLCQKAVSTARIRAKKEKLDFWTIVGDLEKLPLKNDSVDTCLCRATLHHFLSIQPVIKEISRVLKAKGKIVFIEPKGSNPLVRISTFAEKLSGNLLVALGLDTPNETIHSHSCYVSALEEQGFTCVKVCSCYPGSLPPIPCSYKNKGKYYLIMHVLNGIVRLRQFCYLVLNKTISAPFNGNVLVITALK